jgi:predicted dehydrogenase
VAICHVLRYTPFYNAIRNVIRSGELGEIMTFNANEGVGAWHFGHSFVRGHWGNSTKSTPMIVAKCCHDMDILYWLLNRPCEQVSSFGELSFFRKETLTEPRPARCTDWTTPIGEDPWDARKYITDDSCRRWLKMVMDGVDEATPEQITEWLKTSPWGRDAFQCEDNDQPDHLVAILRYMGGITGTFTMTAFEEGRHIEIYGTKAKLRAGAFYKENGPGEITITEHFSKKMRKVDIEEADGGYAGHGGGDWGLVSNLYNDMRVVEDTTLMTTPIQASAHSHVIAFAVEHARRTGEVVDIKEFERRVLAGELNY